MKLFHAVVLVLLADGCIQPAIVAGQTNTAAVQSGHAAGSYSVEILRYDWRDTSRDRAVPVKIYYPNTSEGTLPVIVFSHGLGGSREGYEYLGRHWASCGYVSVHVQHLGSDSKVWQGLPPAEAREKMQEAAVSASNITNRPRDISFVIDQLEKINKGDSPLKGRLDLSRIGVAGHSFGAFTALAVAGETFVLPGGKRVSVVDPRIKAAIPMSSPVPKNSARYDEAFGSIKIPCLHMTGTLDASPIGNTTPKERRVPFDHSRNSDQFLLTFTGGDHMVFSGRGRALTATKRDEELQKLICIGSTAFWDAYLMNDPSAKAYFTGGSFEHVLGSDGTFEKKLCLENSGS